MFGTGKPFQLSLLFVGKAGAYPSGVAKRAPLKDRLERLASDKHSSFLRTLVNYGRKKLFNIGTWTT